MEIKEFSFGVENTTTIGSMSGGAGAGKAKFNEFNVKKAVDLASPVLFKACGLGCHFPIVNLIVRKAGGTKVPYLIFQFKMVFVTKVEWSGGAGEDAPDEDVTFVYGAMQIKSTRSRPPRAAPEHGPEPVRVGARVTNQPNMTTSWASTPPDPEQPPPRG